MMLKAVQHDARSCSFWEIRRVIGSGLRVSHCCTDGKEKKKKRKDYAFRRQFNEKPSIIPGCPDIDGKYNS